MKITLQNLTKVFPKRGKKESGDVIAVNDFTFEILRLDRARIAKLMVIQGKKPSSSNPDKDN